MRNQKGSIAATVLVYSSVMVVVGMAIIGLVIANLKSSRFNYEQSLALQAAEAGAEEMLARINNEPEKYGEEGAETHPPINGTFTYDSKDLSSYETKVTRQPDKSQIINSIGYSPNVLNPKKVLKEIKITIAMNKQTEDSIFKYAVQSASNGVNFGGTIEVQGHVYSGNDITGGSGSLELFGNAYAANAIDDKVKGAIKTPLAIHPPYSAYDYLNSYTEGQLQALIGERELPKLPEINYAAWQEVCEKSGNKIDAAILPQSTINTSDPLIKNMSDGPVVIDGNLSVDDDWEIKGAYWITGNITFNGGDIKLNDTIFSYGKDDEGNLRPLFTFIITNGKITVTHDSVNFLPNSSDHFPVFISRYSEGSEVAVNYNGKNPNSVGFFAPSGEIKFDGASNDGTTSLLVGQKIDFQGNGKVIFNDKLKDALFHTGTKPGTLISKRWQIIK
ncbi:TPA: hypothetical protein DDW69_03750 [candidate division CPR2 bacterium]|uniref:Type 4 fimbrial biogenesis protein PilX N-terminal domain-containing protein n=1 Tax=candidate division CPR2 bacterium GW2011_GWC1_41_48 TaxID=1618344 RepID=A0A0G0W7Q6_UNCC2|nr:MAG: hypothetical protein UT47_C0003G0056 [candidate division CPR2 bacterium GW2011_GWC2_39_35]KKR28829.1 MAG: hypothetical protein UT59_C0018G0008 [candidate division CPR2 bacterium GW2011_GWD1_39_7]KKR29340.1 MAG: hypothetical protein UT60_C0003G0017 [candidate division CPR2 bacterium GW2011_GWD2_39_7]KKS08995.1 MAG: hypothetical protein UU65_C0003G0050 [candidate division CPR2 bacterium GW2011_GWC1_41_48]OGB61438.1 MAG: hypothetical protein A2Y27_03760 [candidate division CPR2 bacterium G